MKKTLSVAFLLALFGPKVLARSNSNLGVHVISETEDSAPVAKAVSARIDSTARYTIVDSKSLLSLDIMCFEIEKIITHSTQRMDGYVCLDSTTYRPAQLAPFDSLLGTQQIIAGKFAEVVEHIFNKFVSETSDEKLELARDEISQKVQYFCNDPAHKTVCGQTKR